jgi:hypothetical protein
LLGRSKRWQWTISIGRSSMRAGSTRKILPRYFGYPFKRLIFENKRRNSTSAAQSDRGMRDRFGGDEVGETHPLVGCWPFLGCRPDRICTVGIRSTSWMMLPSPTLPRPPMHTDHSRPPRGQSLTLGQRSDQRIIGRADHRGAKWCLSSRIVVINVTALTYLRADHCYSVLVFGPLDPQPGATSMGRSTALAR